MRTTYAVLAGVLMTWHFSQLTPSSLYRRALMGVVRHRIVYRAWSRNIMPHIIDRCHQHFPDHDGHRAHHRA